MSKMRIGIAVVVLATLLSSSAFARSRLGVSPLGVARFAVTSVLSLGGLHHGRALARQRHIRAASPRPQNLRNALNSDLRNPVARRQIAAATALAGWHGGQTAKGWWRHGDGGYGWVGPLFWPFASNDINDYIVWGDSTGFWDYGYPDIHAAIFAPYGRDELAAFTGPSPHGRRHRRVPPLQQFCGDDRSEMAALPVGQIQQAIQPNEAQRAALDDLANTWIFAAQMIRATCLTQTAFTAPNRLAIMHQRIGAMIGALSVVREPLGKFHDLLDEEQEARLNALAEERRRTTASGTTDASALGCGAAPSAVLRWPADEIEARLHPSDTQRAALKVLQDANARAVEILSTECQPQDAITAPARLDAVEVRLADMLQAVHLVSTALEAFYGTLSDEQKAQFESIGQKRTA